MRASDRFDIVVGLVMAVVIVVLCYIGHVAGRCGPANAGRQRSVPGLGGSYLEVCRQTPDGWEWREERAP